MADTLEKLNTAQIQHGRNSNRIYLMKIGQEQPSELIARLDDLARRKGYSKIFAKVPAKHRQIFEQAGYRVEARIDKFYKGEDDAIFLGKYPDPARMTSPEAQQIEEILKLAKEKGKRSKKQVDKEQFEIFKCSGQDAEEMSRVYAEVFETYPFPIHDPAYLIETMNSHVIYFGARDLQNGTLAALSSCETDPDNLNVEMTDFATLPEYRGKGLAVKLLSDMEGYMQEKGFIVAYTIARAVSAGMNITFARLGYKFGGTLINNTGISGRIESMNVWHKCL